MRRTDYILVTQTLAQALNEARHEPISGIVLTIMQFADNLSIDNRNFDKLLFLDNILALVVNERGAAGVKLLKDNYLMATSQEVTVF